MAHIELSTEEIQVALEWYAAYPHHPSPVEDTLTAKLEAALPAPTVAVELTVAQLDQIGDWFSYAENEGANSAHSPAGLGLATRIQMVLNPPPEPAEVVVAFTQDEVTIIMDWWADVDDWAELTEEEETLLRKLDKARKGL